MVHKMRIEFLWIKVRVENRVNSTDPPIIPFGRSGTEIESTLILPPRQSVYVQWKKENNFYISRASPFSRNRTKETRYTDKLNSTRNTVCYIQILLTENGNCFNVFWYTDIFFIPFDCLYFASVENMLR